MDFGNAAAVTTSGVTTTTPGLADNDANTSWFFSWFNRYTLGRNFGPGGGYYYYNQILPNTNVLLHLRAALTQAII